MPPRVARVWIPGVLPNLNDLIKSAKGYGGRGFGYAKLKCQWTQTCALHILAAGVPKGIKRARFEFRWVEPNRKRDLDGIAAGGRKVILDSLVLAKVLDNDGWAQIAGWVDTFEVGPKPGVGVTITEVLC
jgi:Holliday junction resolvase RusA-like endonuclease